MVGGRAGHANGPDRSGAREGCIQTSMDHGDQPGGGGVDTVISQATAPHKPKTSPAH